MIDLEKFEVWLVTGSQHLYGKKALEKVAEDARIISQSVGNSPVFPAKLMYKGVLTSSEAIKKICLEANASPRCVGLAAWMHTFSPARMWIAGLKSLQKPLLHFHTQFNENIPWAEIDMDFMNLNQSAHGGREFGFIASRMGLNRKVVVGFWQDPETIDEIATWTRAACGWQDLQGARIARFGDNMRDVAVTEGDKVEAQLRLGYSVNGYGMGDLTESYKDVADAEVDKLITEYKSRYEIPAPLLKDGQKMSKLRESARIELGLQAFLEDGDFSGFTTTFENLHGLPQLPGLAVQRLMARGYGFGAEGDWKTAALLRAMKVMGSGLEGGTSFMEDYTYHLGKPDMRVLGAHMLEVCESIAAKTPVLDIKPLGIGGKDDPARLLFSAPPGRAVNASIIDIGHRFRLIANTVNVVEPEEPLPKLPVARALWEPEPDLRTAAVAWILAGGAHHTAFSMAITEQHLSDFAEMAGIELITIDNSTTTADVKKELRWNEAYYRTKR